MSGYSKSGLPSARGDFHYFQKKLITKTPFTFVRFSDGETEILRKRKLVIGKNIVQFRGVSEEYSYPDFDAKTFDPEVDLLIQQDLMESAISKSKNYYKGIPTFHNRAVIDRDYMVELNGGSTENLTFSDLFLNQNYNKYLKDIVPIFSTFDSVTLVGNFRMKPAQLIPHSNHIRVPDNFFLDYESVSSEILTALQNVPQETLVLSSASSLSNIMGHKLIDVRPDITFIDVGTTLHSKMGLTENIRDYHLCVESWNLKNFRPKAKFMMSSSYRLKW